MAWRELDQLTGSAHWNIRTVGARLKTGNGPWADYDAAAVSLGRAMRALEGSGGPR